MLNIERLMLYSPWRNENARKKALLTNLMNLWAVPSVRFSNAEGEWEVSTSERGLEFWQDMGDNKSRFIPSEKEQNELIDYLLNEEYLLEE